MLSQWQNAQITANSIHGYIFIFPPSVHIITAYKCTLVHMQSDIVIMLRTKKNDIVRSYQWCYHTLI